MLRYNLRSPVPVGEPFGDVLEALILNREQADLICNSPGHHFLVLGDRGVGKSWLVEEVRRRKEARAKAENKELILFQFSGDESLYPEMVLDRLKGKSKRFGLFKGAPFGKTQAEISIELVLPTTIKLGGKFGQDAQSQELSPAALDDKAIQIKLFNETYAARTYLEGLAQGNQGLLQCLRDKLGLKGTPDVMVVFDNFNDPALIQTLAGLFKAYKVFFLVTGGWRLADMRWKEKWTLGGGSAILTNFVPVYLPLVWDMVSIEAISERWVNYSSLTSPKSFREFLQYAAISGRGRLREIGCELNRCAAKEIDESEFAPEAELYEILLSSPVHQSIVEPFSRSGHKDDWQDRALWCLCYLAHEFSKQLTPFTTEEIEAISRSLLEQVIPSQTHRLWLIDSWLEQLTAGDWRFLKKGKKKKTYEYSRPIAAPIKCPNPQCGNNRHRPAAQHCAICGNRLPIPEKLSGAICPSPTCVSLNRPGAKFCYKCGTPLVWMLPEMPAPRYGTGKLPSAATLGGRYVIVQKLAQGGMGAIYKALDRRLKDREVAVKEMSLTLIVPAELPQVIAAFRQEAEMLARLDHPNLVKVFDLFEEYSRQYMVMELIQGRSLLEILESEGSKGLPEDRVLIWAEQLCAVLAYLHSQQPKIIYRDLKPSNVLELTGTTHAKLIDFGIARLYRPGVRKDTVIFGTPGYAAPEQYGQGQTDERSDSYSLGVTLHHLLTGHDPANTPFNLPPVRRFNTSVSQRVSDAIAKAVAVRREDRFSSMAEMKAALLGK